MQKHIFAAQTDVEIGDNVYFKGDNNEYIIYDIRLIQQLRHAVTRFEFLLVRREGSTGWVQREDFIYPIPDERCVFI